MIDRIVISKDTATIVFLDRSPVTITSKETPIRTFLRWMFTPVTITYQEFGRAVEIENENTQEISLKEVA